jgi:hypothetical protein
MGFAPVIPGQQDVNDAFSPPNLPRTKREFQTLKARRGLGGGRSEEKE